MGLSETLPLMAIEEFLTEVETIQQLITEYDENLDKIDSNQEKLLRLSWTPDDRENLSSELEGLRTKNKEIRKSIAEVREEKYAAKP